MAVHAGADALGLVSAMPSGPGSISDEAVANFTAKVPPLIAPFYSRRSPSRGDFRSHERTRPTAVQIVSHIDPSEAAAFATWNHQ